MEVVLVVVQVLLQHLLAPVVAVPNARLGMAVGSVLRELVRSFQALQVVLQCLRSVVPISDGVTGVLCTRI